MWDIKRVRRDATVIESATEDVGGVKSMLAFLFLDPNREAYSGSLNIRIPYDSALNDKEVIDVIGCEARDACGPVIREKAFKSGNPDARNYVLKLSDIIPYVCVPVTSSSRGLGNRKKSVIKQAMIEELYKKLDKPGRVEFWENILIDNCLGR